MQKKTKCLIEVQFINGNPELKVTGNRSRALPALKKITN